jgi:hypothetical protein
VRDKDGGGEFAAACVEQCAADGSGCMVVGWFESLLLILFFFLFCFFSFFLLIVSWLCLIIG